MGRLTGGSQWEPKVLLRVRLEVQSICAGQTMDRRQQLKWNIRMRAGMWLAWMGGDGRGAVDVAKNTCSLRARVKQMSPQGVKGLTEPLQGQKEKMEVPNGEGALPPSAAQKSCLSFPTPWAT